MFKGICEEFMSKIKLGITLLGLGTASAQALQSLALDRGSQNHRITEW